VRLLLSVRCFGFPKHPVLLDRFVYEIRGINGLCGSLSLLTNLCIKCGFECAAVKEHSLGSQWRAVRDIAPKKPQRRKWKSVPVWARVIACVLFIHPQNLSLYAK
jgi:hypothetical protein